MHRLSSCMWCNCSLNLTLDFSRIMHALSPNKGTRRPPSMALGSESFTDFKTYGMQNARTHNISKTAVDGQHYATPSSLGMSPPPSPGTSY